MSDYLETKVKPVRRAIILAFLEASRDHVSNADILTSVVNSTSEGVSAWYNDVVSDLRWLEQKGLVEITGSNTVVVTATAAGLRIARGENADPGIARDLPGA